MLATQTYLDEGVPELARKRADLATLEAELANRREEWERENAQLLADVQEAKTLVAKAENNVREWVLALYRETSDKRPHAAVSIRVYKVAQYDQEQARVWAQEKRPDLIVLDAKGYEKVLKSDGRDPEMPGEVVEEPRATIATDLSAYL